MIVSVSRRTDIPAFYSEWFFNRLREGFVYVKNPYNSKQISKVELNPNTVDCFVFWTKDATPMLNRLDELKQYKYYFQFTITPYGNDVEKGIDDKKEIINSFKSLSNRIGKERVILRYDPIILSDKYTIEYHCKEFKKLCFELDGCVDKCIISFLDFYKKTQRNTKGLGFVQMNDNDIANVAKKISDIAKFYDIKLETCSENIDLSAYNIGKGKCIDDKLISNILGVKVDVKKDPNQREACGCVKSVDIGQYNTCKHHCVYCYANFNYSMVENNVILHNPISPMLIGFPSSDTKITIRNLNSIKCGDLNENQLSLFDEIF